jgi:uncharacterized protein (TIGR02001 family)
MRQCAVLTVTFAAFAALAGAAQAQWSASVGIDSDNRFRGVSLSRGHPSPRAGVTFDFAGGAYIGATVALVEPSAGRRTAQSTVYAGFARRFGEGPWAWELGLAATQVGSDDGQHYVDRYIGLLGDGWALRLHDTPEDLERGVHTRYLELNGGQRLSAAWRLAWHIGALHTGAERDLNDRPRRWRADARIGVALQWNDVELRVAWVGAQREPAGSAAGLADNGYPPPLYPPQDTRGTSRSTVVVGVSAIF